MLARFARVFVAVGLLGSWPLLAQGAGGSGREGGQGQPAAPGQPGGTGQPGGNGTDKGPNGSGNNGPSTIRTGRTPAAGDRNRTGQAPGDAQIPAPEGTAEQRPRAWDYYPKRPDAVADNPALASLLDEIEGEAESMPPLFGQALFRSAIIDHALRAVQPTAVNAEPGPNFRLAPGDRISITFYNKLVDPVTVEVAVQPDGRVAFDPVGVVQVSGLTVAEFQDLMTRLIRLRGPRDATVQFAFVSLHAMNIRVTGEVRRQAGVVLLSGYGTLLDALAESGGPKAFGSLRHVALYRGGTKSEIDLYRYLLSGDPTANPALRDGDVIHLPVADRVVSLEGELKRPARYELVTETTLPLAIGLAGGVGGRGARVQVQRVQNFEKSTLIDLDVQAVMAGQADTAVAEPLRDGDVVRVLPVPARPQLAVQVHGALGQPGEFGFRRGMTLAEAFRLAQGVSVGGYAAIGHIRRLQANGSLESISFPVAEVLAGGAAAKLELQPGDEVLVPTRDEQPKLSFSVSGAVYRPGAYQSNSSLTISDLVLNAGGFAPGADVGHATLRSPQPAGVVSIPIDLSEMVHGGAPKPNPTLVNGDELTIPFVLRLHVTVSGEVTTPGPFELTGGMSVKDLLERAGGVLPRADKRGRLRRVVVGTRDTEDLYLDLARAAAGQQPDNALLRDGDELQVFNAAALSSAVENIVYVSGAVKRPGPFARVKGMRITDLVNEAGGLLPEANRDEAQIRRLVTGGRRQLIRFSLARAYAGTDAENYELTDGDVVDIPPLTEVTIRPATATVFGAVYRTGPVILAENMTISDLITAAGGFLPDAFRKRVLLTRLNPDQTKREVAFDLTLESDYPVRRDDSVRVYRYDQVRYRNNTVTVSGDVQVPGVCERTEGMTLYDLLFKVGGLTRNPDVVSLEVARVTATGIQRYAPNTVQVMAQDAEQNLVLQDEDRIYVRNLARPDIREVLVKGEVREEGPVPLLEETDSLRRLVQRVGIRKETAFIEGAILMRRIDEIVSPDVARFASELYRAVKLEHRRNDLALVLTRTPATAPPNVLESLINEPTEIATDAATGSVVQEVTGVASPTVAQDASKLLLPPGSPDREAAAAAFATTSLNRYLRVAIDLAAVIDGRQDVSLRPNDILVIPPVPQTVLVQGQVYSNQFTPQFVPNQTVLQYVATAGGFRPSADKGAMLVVRANGSLERAAGNTLVRRGDIVMVLPAPLRLPAAPGAAIQTFQAISQLLGGLATTALAITQVTK